MSKASTYLEQIIELYTKIQEELEEQELEFYKCGAKQQDLLHEIENTVFNAPQGYRLSKALKEVRIQRRMEKDELDLFKILNEHFISKTKEHLFTTAEMIKNKEDKIIEAKENKMYRKRIEDNVIVFSTNKKALKLQESLEQRQGLKEEQIFTPNAITAKDTRVEIKGEDEEFYICTVELKPQIGVVTYSHNIKVRKSKIKKFLT